MNTNKTAKTPSFRRHPPEDYRAMRSDYQMYTPENGRQKTYRLSAGSMVSLRVPITHRRPQIQPSAEIVDVPHFDVPRYLPVEHPAQVVKKRFPWRLMMFRATLAACAVVLIIGGFLSWRAYSDLHKVFRGRGTVAALDTKSVVPSLLKGEGDGRVNVLLLGVGGKNHDGGDLTDTMMVFSVDPVNKKAAMLSVPRDLWVKMPVNFFGQYQKINAAYSSGKYKYLGKADLGSGNEQAVAAGFNSIDQAISNVLGVNIDYHVLVDFQAFEQAVDTVNGVSVDVKDKLYDPTMAWENANNPVLAQAGLQVMLGKQALMYARSRETSSDFARNDRQRQLLLALKQKALTIGTLSNPTRLEGLMSAFGDNIRTDLSTQAASRLYMITKDIPDTNIASLSLTNPQNLVTIDRVGDISVVRPRAGFNTYSEIQSYVRNQLVDGYLTKENAPVYVLGETDSLRQGTVDTLTNYGYNLRGSSVSSSVGSSGGVIVVDLSGGRAPFTLHYLQDRYGVVARTQLPAGVQVPTGTQFAIIVGA